MAGIWIERFLSHTPNRSGFGLIALIVVLIQGCALSPKSDEARLASARLLEAQLQSIEAGLKAHPKDKRALIYLGSAQHSNSKAFERDVLRIQERVATLNPKVHSIILSNELQTKALQYPFATLPSLNLVMKQLAVWSKTYPLTLVMLVSTHCSKDVLTVNAANDNFPHLTSARFQELLKPLGETPTLMILSACHSGSLLAPLAAPNRIILTAAAADKVSFGCNFQSQGTYFVRELDDKGWRGESTFTDVFEKTAAGVLELETRTKQTPHSDPQMSLPKRYESVTLRQFLNQ